jgi:hypothetical protein
MNTDLTEPLRRDRLVAINAASAGRTELERRHGQVWDADELRTDFEVLGFAAPFVVVRRRQDGRLGSLEFQHEPRLYFNWKEDTT